MRLVPEGWNVVVVGAWNVAILNPEWLGKNVFGTDQVKLEIPVGGHPLAFLRVTGDGVRIITAPDKVQFSPVEVTTETLTKVEATVGKLLDLLPHTPVAAIGANFTFQEHDPAEELVEHFLDPDLGSIIDLGFTSEAHTYTRHLKQEDGATLNLKTHWDARDLLFEFNFHRDVAKADAAAAAVRGKLVAYRDTAYKILLSVYGLQPE